MGMPPSAAPFRASSKAAMNPGSDSMVVMLMRGSKIFITMLIRNGKWMGGMADGYVLRL